MRLSIIYVLCLPVWLCLTSWTPAQEKIKDSPYYPFKVGSRWVYRVGSRTVTAHVARHELIAGMTCACIEAGEGDDFQVEYLAVKADGIYRCKVHKDELEPPLLLLKLPPKTGDKWTVSSKFGEREARGTFTLGEAEVVVPAGKFKTVTVSSDDFQIGGERLALTYWFAQGVGVVKQSIRVGGGEIVLELEKFQMGK